MSQLNKFWMMLIFIGVFALVFSFGWNIFRAVSGQEVEFNEKVTSYKTRILIPDYLESHLLIGTGGNLDDFNINTGLESGINNELNTQNIDTFDPNESLDDFDINLEDSTFLQINETPSIDLSNDNNL